MIHVGKCPKCEKTVVSAHIEHIDIKEGFQSAWKGVSYHCHWCKCVLGVGIDPVALKTDTINGILDALKHR